MTTFLVKPEDKDVIRNDGSNLAYLFYDIRYDTIHVVDRESLEQMEHLLGYQVIKILEPHGPYRDYRKFYEFIGVCDWEYEETKDGKRKIDQNK